MPTYTFRDRKTGKKSTAFMSIAEMEETVAAGEMELMVSTPSIVSGRGMQKPAAGFRDLLKTIKKNHRGSTIKV